MTKGGRRLSYEDDFWYKWKIRRFPLTFLFRELFPLPVELFPLPVDLFPLPVTQKSIQCKSSKTKKNSWNLNHISVIFFDKKNNGNLNTTTKASEMKERLLKNDLLYQNELKSVQNYEWILMKKTTESCAKFLCFSCVKYNPTFVIFVNNSMHTHGNTHSKSIRIL